MSNLSAISFGSANDPQSQPAADGFSKVAPWRGILAVEPDIAALHAGTLLLTQANYSVTPASGDDELFLLRETKAIGLAILSDRLGKRLLEAVAATVRRQWPRTRILILGEVPAMLDDHLYDERIERSPDPDKVLSDLELLYRGMWNERSNTLDWNAVGCVSRPMVLESDPTKAVAAASEDGAMRGTPADLRKRERGCSERKAPGSLKATWAMPQAGLGRALARRPTFL
jgi:hypothetical protein